MSFTAQTIGSNPRNHRAWTTCLILVGLAATSCSERPDTAATTQSVLELSAPSLTIGSDEPHYEFHRVLGARRLSDGRIAVLNLGTSQLRYYDSTGKYLNKVGRSGAGPGEFRAPEAMCRLAGDSILIAEAQSGNPSNVFDATGRYARSISASPSRAIRGCSSDGDLLLVDYLPPWQGPRAEIWRDSSTFHVYNNRRQRPHPLGQFPIQELFRTRRAGRAGRADVPFGRFLISALGPGAAYIGTQDSAEIRVFGPDGRESPAIRWVSEQTPVTQAVIKEFEDSNSAWLARIAKQYGRTDPPNTAKVPYPRAMPAYSALAVSSSGDLWVREYHPKDVGLRIGMTNPHHRWRIFKQTGQQRAVIKIPTSLDIMDVGPDYLVGRWKDDAGVETIRLYRIEIPTGK